MMIRTLPVANERAFVWVAGVGQRGEDERSDGSADGGAGGVQDADRHGADLGRKSSETVR